MLPFLLPMWESDATLRAAVEQSYATSITTAGGDSALTGVETALDLKSVGDTAEYGLNLSGLYARILQPSVFDDAEDPPPANNLAGSIAGHGSWQTSPLTRLSLDSSGYLASRLGVRAEDALAARDPFMGDRVQYTFGGGSGLSAIASRRSTWLFSGGYTQAGAVAADDPKAVGIDAHIGRAGISDTYEIGDVDAVIPEVRYTYTHFYHALYDIFLTRGPADIHAGTALMGERHRFTRRFYSTISGGATVASPPPILSSDAPVVSPEAHLAVDYVGKRYHASANYGYAYTSLGPRIGFGHEHSALAELGLRPVRGARLRDFWVTGVARFAYGTAPVAANPPLVTGDAAPVPADGMLTTYTAAAGLKIDYPIARGLSLLGGFDVEYLRADFDPVPPTGATDPSLRTIVMVGLAGTLSTDRQNTLRREIDTDDDERQRSRVQDPDGERNIDDEHAPTGSGVRGTTQTTLESSEAAALAAKEAAKKAAESPPPPPKKPAKPPQEDAPPAPPPAAPTSPPAPTPPAAPPSPPASSSPSPPDASDPYRR